MHLIFCRGTPYLSFQELVGSWSARRGKRRKQYTESRAHIMRTAEVILCWRMKSNWGQKRHRVLLQGNYNILLQRLTDLFLILRLLVPFPGSRLSQQVFVTLLVPASDEIVQQGRLLVPLRYNSPLRVTQNKDCLLLHVSQAEYISGSHHWVNKRTSTFVKKIPLDSSITYWNFKMS
jgi:hypothetical protein